MLQTVFCEIVIAYLKQQLLRSSRSSWRICDWPDVIVGQSAAPHSQFSKFFEPGQPEKESVPIMALALVDGDNPITLTSEPEGK